MKICFITWSIKLNTLYKYYQLEDELKKNNIQLDIFITSSKNYQILQTLKIPRIKIIKLLNNEINFTNYNQIYLSVDFNYIKKMNDFGRLKIDLPYWKVYLYKFRNCNDLYPPIKFGKKFKKIIVPSKLFNNNNSLLNNFFNIKKLKIKYSNPIEMCDTSNNFIKLSKKDIEDKYRIDNGKKNILYFSSVLNNINDLNKNNTDYKIINRLHNDQHLNKKYNIFISLKPYIYHPFIFLNENIRVLDEFDFEFIIKNYISCIIGGLSSTVRESLIYQIPVLNIFPNYYKYNFNGRGSSGFYHEFLKIRYNNAINGFNDFFEGENVSVNDNWINKLDRIENSKYDFNKKKSIWFSGININNIIYENLLN